MIEEFKEISFSHIEREKNRFTDVLATLASMTKIDCEIDIQPLQIEVRDSLANCTNLEKELDGHP